MKVKTRWTGVICSLLMILTAVLTAVGCGGKSFKITFDYNYDGAPEASVMTVGSGDMITLPDDPVREGFRFEGWFTDKAATQGAQSQLGYGVTADATYYAGWSQTSATVTFDSNYEGGASATVTVEIGGKITQPADPVREGYLFLGWYADSACTAEYDFDANVTENLTVYAGWEADDGNTLTVSFEYNYAGGGTYYSTKIKTGRRVAQPAAPVREGYAFLGWYTDEECASPFSFTTMLRADTSLYAYWLKEWAFEAEYTDVSAITGRGYSGEFTGTNIILRDTQGLKASNDFFVSYLYSQDIELVFEIEAANAVENAVLDLSLSAEKADVTISPDNYTVQVNGTAVSYGRIALTDVAATANKMLEFSRYRISMQVRLKAGHNVIKLITSNDEPMRGPSGEPLGTMYATAPVVDCLYLYTDTALSWAAGKCFEGNIADK